MVALITMVAVISSYLLVNVLSRTTTEVKLDNNQRTLEAMKEAKTALIAYAASLAWSGSAATDQPGSLPCPSINEDGVAGDCTTDNTLTAYLGRVPWNSIGSSKVRDGSGSVLWYALSPSFRKFSGTTIINSDTQGTLSITGTSPASAVVGVVIAPGAAVAGQSRTESSVASTYLEGSNATATSTGVFQTAQSTDTFNDQVLPITLGDLMAVVEPAVAARMERDIKPYLTAHYSDWGMYPYPAYFNHPTVPTVGPGASGPLTTRAQSLYLGNSATTGTSGTLPPSEGMIPVSASVNSWSGGAVSVVSSTKGVISQAATCASVANVGYRCTFKVSGSGSPNRITSMKLQMLGTADSAGLGFSYKPTVSSVTTTVSTGSSTFSSTSFSVGSLTSAGAATMTYVGTIANCTSSCSTARTVTITFADLVTRGISSSTDPSAGWFIKNEWYRQTYYAVASGYRPGGAGSCTAATNCLTVSDLPSSYATSNDKRAILVFMGYALTGSRPSSSLTSYLENVNATVANPRTFKHRSGIATSINDRVVVIAP